MKNNKQNVVMIVNNKNKSTNITLKSIKKVIKVCNELPTFTLNYKNNNIIDTTPELIGNVPLYKAFKKCVRLTSVAFPEVTNIGNTNNIGDIDYIPLYKAFYECTNLESVTFNELTTITGIEAMYAAFDCCYNLKSINLPKLTTIIGESTLEGAFGGCTNLESVVFPKLATVKGHNTLYNIFFDCNNLKSVNFPELVNISSGFVLRGAFSNCTKLTSVFFPKLNSLSFGRYKTQFKDMLKGVDGCSVHFPASIKEKIENWANVRNGFGGTNTKVVFDL